MDIQDQRIINFLKSSRVGVLSVLLKNGFPHGATVHFSHQENPIRLFFLTDRNYKKCEALLEGNPVQASFVTGFSEEEMRTLQLDGTARIVSGADELTTLKQVHFRKIPTAKQYEDDPDSVFLEFIPAWWQYSDYTTDPETRISGQA